MNGFYFVMLSLLIDLFGNIYQTHREKVQSTALSKSKNKNILLINATMYLNSLLRARYPDKKISHFDTVLHQVQG